MFQPFQKIIATMSVITILFTGLTVFAGDPERDGTYNGTINAILADNDSNSGLDGRDISVSWTKLESQPDGFANYKLYILPSQMFVDSVNAFAQMCSGACTPLATITDFNTVSTTLASSVTNDSKGNIFAADPTTQACIVITATSSKFDCSPAVALNADGASVSGISELAISDVDTTGFGLDGRDIKLSWTVTGSAPVNFSQRWLFVLPQSVISLVKAGSKDLWTNACVDGETPQGCRAVGIISSFPATSYTAASSVATDSDGTPWSAGTTYGVCVMTAVGQSNYVDCTSSGISPTADSPTDVSAPFINFMPSQFSRASSNFVVYANISDEQTTAAAFHNTSDGGNELFQLCHGTDVSSSEACVNATQVAGNLFMFTVTSYSGVPTDSAFEYYVIAQDGASTPNVDYFCNTPDAISSKAECQAAPFVATVKVFAGYSVAGTVKNPDGAGLSGVPVFIGGFPASHVLTDGVGNFIIPNLPKGYGFDVVSTNGVACPTGEFVNINPTTPANVTGLVLTLNVDSPCQSTETAPPVVLTTVPFDGATGVSSTSQSFAIQSSQPLNSATVIDGDHVILTPDGGTTLMPGSVQYCETMLASDACATVADIDTEMTDYILFIAQGLQPNTTYEVIVNPSVTTEGGQPFPASLRFTTAGALDAEAIDDNFGDSGAYMPPMVKSFVPRPGSTLPVNSRLIVVFDKQMDPATVNPGSVKLLKNGVVVNAEVSLDPSLMIAKIYPGTKDSPVALPANFEYELQISGKVATSLGLTARPSDEINEVAFSANFFTNSLTDSTSPTLTSFVADGSTVSVNKGVFEFASNESLDPSFVNNSTVTLSKGNTAISTIVDYNEMSNTFAVIPRDVLAQSSSYTININGVKDLAGNAVSSYSLSFSTSDVYDITSPNLIDVRCDDYMCKFLFDEPMKNVGASDADWANSILNHANITLTSGGSDLVTASTGVSWDSFERTAIVNGVNLTLGNSFIATIATTSRDLSGNPVNSTSSANVWSGTVESPGSLGGVAENIGGENVFDEFENKTADDFMSGAMNMAYPFNPMVGADSGVFQTRVSFGIPVLDEDQIKLTFPTGTTVTNAAQDTWSPFADDFNDFGSGTVTFDASYDTDGIAVNTNLRTVTVQLDVTGTPEANDFYTLDLKKIINPLVTIEAGYDVKVQLIRSGVTKVTLDADDMMNYYLTEGGSNTITLKTYASTAGSGEAGANGSFFMWGGGPGGPMDKTLTLTDGITTAADGTAIAGDAGLVFSSLPDGCYNFGTEPFVTLGASDYFGRGMPEPVCVFGGQSKTKNIVLTKAAAGNSANVTVKIVKESGFRGVDIDFFASGPGGFFVKTISSVDVPNVNGYPVILRSNGESSIGFGPAMAKGTSTSQPDFAAFGATPPPPVSLMVRGLGTESQSVSLGGMGLPQGVTFDDATDTITFTISDSDLDVLLNVSDNSGNPISNAEVFIFSPFGGTFRQTDASGNATLSIAEYGPYEVGAWMHGLGETTRHIEVLSTGVKMNGSLVETVNLVLSKPDYSISGTVYDSNGSPIAYAPVWATDANGNTVHGGTDSSGIYTHFVGAGTWTLVSALPPDKTTECGVLSKTVVITNASKSVQNMSPTAATCLTLSGTVTVDGSLQASTFVFIEEWDTENDRPAGGFHRGTNTDSDGAYATELPAGTYRVGTLGTFGEITETVTVSADNATLNLNTGDLVDVTFTFTGGASDMGGFIELKNADDRHTRIGTPFNDASEDVVVGVKSGTYNYFVDVFGAEQFSGTVVATSTSTVTIDTSASALITLSGTVLDSNEVALANVVVSANDFANGIRREAVTNDTGAYSLQVKAGDYSVNTGLAGYAGTPQQIVLSANTTLNSVMTAATNTITGTVYQSDGSTPAINGGRVRAMNSEREVVSAAINAADGTYILAVTDDDSWQISAAAPLHADTDFGSTVDTTDETADTGKDLTLTADATKTLKSASQSIAIASGGTVDDSDSSGLRVSAPAGALSANNVNATLSLEQNFKAPLEDGSFTVANGKTYSVTATDANNTQIKEPTGCIDITVTYDPTELSEGVDEADLELKRLSVETDTYVDCSCGSSIDTVNNTVTCSSKHLSDFALVVANSALAPATPSGLAATASSDTQIDLSWTASAGATGYDIYRSTDAAGPFARLGSEPTVSSGATVAYADTVLTAETTYYYKISSLNASGESASSSAVNDTTEAAAVVTPSATPAATGGGIILPSGGGSSSNDDEDDELEEEGDDSVADESEEEGDDSVVADDEVSESVEADDTANDAVSEPAEHWARSYIENMFTKEIITSVLKNTYLYSPDDYMTRAGFIEVLVSTYGYDVPDSVEDLPFSDVSPNATYAPYIKAAYDHGVIEGSSSTTFDPTSNLTRAEALKFFIVASGIDVSEVLYEAVFPDVEEGAWYAPYVSYASQEGIVGGYVDGTFGPDKYLTRGQIAKIATLFEEKGLVGALMGLFMM